MEMLVAFSVFEKDVDALQRLLKWCGHLGPYPEHSAVIVCDAATPFDKAITCLKLAKSMFKTAAIITNGQSVIGWVEGPKSLFITTAKHAAGWGLPFLLMETDSIPLKRGWLDQISVEFSACGRPFMGHVYECHQVGLPSHLMSGIGVYAPDIVEAIPAIEAGANWDVAMTDYVLPRAHHTKLIHHLWGEPHRSPSFARKAIPPDVFGIDQLPPEAVIWHRDKTQSLIRLLERQMFPAEVKTEQIVACFNVHAGDIGLAVHHSNWLRTMGRFGSHKAIICHDPSCPVLPLNALEQNLRFCFERVETFVYQRPPLPSYPHAANWAWQSIALHMTNQTAPWLFFEADAVVLRRDWLERLQAEYDDCCKSWMGPHVKGMAHANGSMIYPADAAHRMGTAMACTDQAWDYHAASDYMADCHDCSHLLQHVWSIVGEDACEVGGGQIPANVTLDRARRWVKPGAVCIHRIKDVSLVNLLLSGEFRP